MLDSGFGRIYNSCMQKNEILCCDSDRKFHALFKKIFDEEFSLKTVPLISTTELKRHLLNNPKIFAAFTEFQLEKGFCHDVLDQLNEYDSSIPVYLVSPHSQKEITNVVKKEFAGYIQKPDIAQILRNITNKLLEEQSQAEDSGDDEFAEITLYSLMQISDLICDVFVRINKDKFVKVVPGGSLFTKEDF